MVSTDFWGLVVLDAPTRQAIRLANAPTRHYTSTCSGFEDRLARACACVAGQFL